MSLKKSLILSILVMGLIIIGASKPVELFVQNILVSTRGFVANENTVEQSSNKNLKSAAKLKQLEQENSSLRKALKLQQDSNFKSVNAYVIGQSNSFLLKRIGINKGAEHGIEPGQVVLADGVVIGKVHSVEKNNSRVILSEDQDFRLEVEFSNNRGVLKGLINGAIVDRVLPNALIRKNDLVVTIAQPNKIPAGLPVGRIVSTLGSKEEAFKQVQIAGYEKSWSTYVVQVVVDER